IHVVVFLAVIADGGGGGSVFNFLYVIEVGEGAAALRGLAGYFDIVTNLVIIGLDANLNVVTLDCGAGDVWMSHGWILSGGCGLVKVPERLPGAWQVALSLVEIKRLGGGGVCFGDLPCCGEYVREFEQDVCVLTQQVGLRREGCRRAGEFLGFAITAPVS